MGQITDMAVVLIFTAEEEIAVTESFAFGVGGKGKVLPGVVDMKPLGECLPWSATRGL